jgi:hypothetical protein
MFLRFMVFMGIFIISAACSFIMTELHEQHPENKRYKVYCIFSAFYHRCRCYNCRTIHIKTLINEIREVCSLASLFVIPLFRTHTYLTVAGKIPVNID